MTRLSDLLQIALSLDQPWNFLAALAILCAIWQGWKIFAAIWRAFIWVVKRVWAIRIRFGFEQGWFWGIIKTGFIAGLAALICAFSAPISDGLQWMEQRYLKPAYVVQYDTTIAGDAYEAEMLKHLSIREAEIFKKRIAEIAAKYGSTQLAMYEVGFSECALNPFAFNRNRFTGDTVAAGFIQFTANGIKNVLLEGQHVTMRQVKDWCNGRQLDSIMLLTDAYFEAVCNGRPLPRPIDVYTAVFAPKFIGCGDSQVLYDRKTWEAAYTQNIGFDGYFVEALPNGKQIIRQTIGARDGKITIHDVRLHLERKKALLVGAWVRKKA